MKKAILIILGSMVLASLATGVACAECKVECIENTLTISNATGKIEWSYSYSIKDYAVTIINFNDKIEVAIHRRETKQWWENEPDVFYLTPKQLKKIKEVMPVFLAKK